MRFSMRLGVSLPAAVFAFCVSASAHDCTGPLLEGQDILGDAVCLPPKPQRIVTMDPFYSLLMAMELEAPVVGTALSGSDLPPQMPQRYADEIEVLVQATAPNLEAILSVRPDLILGSAYGQEKLHAQLQAIAPTVLIDPADWRTYFRLVARSVDREALAEQKLKGFQERLDATARSLPENTSVSFIRIVPGGFQVYVAGPNAYAPMALLTELGLERPPFETGTDNTVLRRPTQEGLLQVQGDSLIYTIGGAHHDGDAEALEREVTGSPIWQALPAVKAHRAFKVDPAHWMGFGGIASAHAILDDLREIFGLVP